MDSRRRAFIAGSVAALGAGLSHRVGSAAPSKGSSTVLTLAGDTLITRRVPRNGDARFNAVAQLLRNADATIASGVMTFADTRSLPPAPKGVDLNLLCPSTGAGDLGWMGVKLLSYAGNHVLDYGIDGLRATLQNLRHAGIAVAGAGDTLTAAASPAYVGANPRRVAVIGCATTFPETWIAADARHDAAGRPGVNGIRVDLTYRLPPNELEKLRQIGSALGPGIAPLHDLVPGADGLLNATSAANSMSFLDRKFIQGAPGVHAIPRADDRKRLLDSIKLARQSAAIVCVMLHEHGIYGPGTFVQNMARECIDAGADCFFVAGAHVFGAVELYRGKPILHGLGNLFFEYETLARLPAEVFEAYGFARETRNPAVVLNAVSARYFDGQPQFWQSAIARLQFSGGKFAALEIHPIDLGFGNARGDRGTPRIASAPQAAATLERVAAASRAFGTTLSVRDSIGWVEP